MKGQLWPIDVLHRLFPTRLQVKSRVRQLEQEATGFRSATFRWTTRCGVQPRKYTSANTSPKAHKSTVPVGQKTIKGAPASL